MNGTSFIKCLIAASYDLINLNRDVIWFNLYLFLLLTLNFSSLIKNVVIYLIWIEMWCLFSGEISFAWEKNNLKFFVYKMRVTIECSQGERKGASRCWGPDWRYPKGWRVISIGVRMSLSDVMLMVLAHCLASRCFGGVGVSTWKAYPLA